MKDKVFIIIPVHNRKSITLKCLDTLEQNGDLAQFSVIVVDDGSTDGTSSAIQERFPEVQILQGDGNLWWTGAICMGMKHAINRGAEYLIWLNDDCLPAPNSILFLLQLVIADSNRVAGGNIIDPQTGRTLYSGINYFPYPPQLVTQFTDDSLVECDTLSGNLVCLSQKLVNDIGLPNYKLFPHYNGELMYLFKAKKKGYSICICPSAIGYAEPKIEKYISLSLLNTKTECCIDISQRFNVKYPSYWKADLSAYFLVYGMKGFIYRVMSILSITLIVMLLPKNTREFLHRPIMNIYNKVRYVL